MSIIIKGMEMPKNCRDCGIEQEGFWCGALDGYQNTRCFTNERREDCPLVELPPHGRLIDADAIDTSYSDPEVIETLQDAPTIIEAETCNKPKETCNKPDEDAVIANNEEGKT